MRKIRIILLAIFLTASVPGYSFAINWSQYESIRDNIRLEGYQGMPGYMAFGDGDGNILGYVWMSSGKGLVWCSATNGTSYTAGNVPNVVGGPGHINLKTTKLTDDYGIPIATEWTGNIIDGVKY